MVRHVRFLQAMSVGIYVPDHTFEDNSSQIYEISKGFLEAHNNLYRTSSMYGGALGKKLKVTAWGHGHAHVGSHHKGYLFLAATALPLPGIEFNFPAVPVDGGQHDGPTHVGR